MADARADIVGIQHDIREIRDDLAGRPSWAVSSLITALTAACSVLATMLAIAAG